jgi:UDP-3-O-[3-hydroxymyristoyl] glucosamine N-acyltransferase
MCSSTGSFGGIVGSGVGVGRVVGAGVVVGEGVFVGTGVAVGLGVFVGTGVAVGSGVSVAGAVVGRGVTGGSEPQTCVRKAITTITPINAANPIQRALVTVLLRRMRAVLLRLSL